MLVRQNPDVPNPKTAKFPTLCSLKLQRGSSANNDVPALKQQLKVKDC